MEVILADSHFTDIRALRDFETIDCDCGGTNDFEMKIDSDDYESDVTYGNIIYIPNTECGGIIGEIESDTSIDTVYVRGYTWRGLLDKKIIIPDGDYKTVTGDLADIVGEVISDCFDSIFIADDTPTGVTKTYQFDRYCTVLAGLEKMLKEEGYRLNIAQIDSSVVVSAKPIKDYSDEIELSQDSELNFNIIRNKRGINHLICLGKGELSDRLVRHLYAWPDGSIQTTQYYTGINELQAVYDYSSADDETTLVEGGKDRLTELMNSDSFEMNVEELGISVAIGDVIGGRDYLTGILVREAVKSIVWRVEEDEVRLDYTLEGSMNA